MNLAKKVIDKMIEKDAFSKWLGIQVLEISSNLCKVQLKVRSEMTNGFNIAHGGISYSLADSALAFAANSDGIKSLSIETTISHTKKVETGDIITATTCEISKNSKYAEYKINITNQNNIQIAHFRGKVYRTKNEWFPKN